MQQTPISNNLRRLRTAKGLTQEEVASGASISLAAYRNFESGRTIPKVNTLLAIAQQLDTTLNDIVSEPRRLRSVRFRAQKRLNTREQILIDTANWLQDFQEIEDITGDHPGWKLEHLKLDDVNPEAAANAVREALALKDEPIRNIAGLLEDACGIKVLSRPVSSEYFYGLSVGEEDGGPAIIVNTWNRIPVERWIFSAAHELGHIMLHRESFKVEEEQEEKQQELEANQFATYFLMPRKLFHLEWSKSEGLPFLDRVFKVKRMFRVSYKTVLYRLETDYGRSDIWGLFYSLFINRYGNRLDPKKEPRGLDIDAFSEDWAAREPKRLEDVDFIENRLSRLVREALEKELITRDRAAEVLRLSPDEMLNRIKEWAA